MKLFLRLLLTVSLLPALSGCSQAPVNDGNVSGLITEASAEIISQKFDSSMEKALLALEKARNDGNSLEESKPLPSSSEST